MGSFDLTSFHHQLASAKARAGRAGQALARVEATVASRDGSVTATVGRGGALRRLVLGERATALSRVQLAAAVLATVQQAQQECTRLTVEAVASPTGAQVR